METQRIAITEEQGVHKQWYEEAKKQALATLPAFIERVTNGYAHDYGTCVHATAACAIAAAWAANNVVGLTGFQAGGVMWQFIREWNYSTNKCGLRILDYDNVLYPQYKDSFAGQVISKDVWRDIQAEAAAKLAENRQKGIDFRESHAIWEKEIAAFKITYPDYDKRPEYYNRIGAGTGDQWEAERIKEESGFVFAPTEPFDMTAHYKVSQHWERISKGALPFGMRIGEN